MSPRRPAEPLSQRRLALVLREALARHDRDAVLDLILDHPVGVRASHVRHNLSETHSALLDGLIGEAGLLQFQSEDR